MGQDRSEPAFSRRRHVRLRLPEGSLARIRILAVHNARTPSAYGGARLINISEGGCCFASGLRFPVHPALVLEVQLAEGEIEAALAGKIVWRHAENGGYRYGLQFELCPKDRFRLARLLNGLLMRLCPGQARIHALYRWMSGRAWGAGGDERVNGRFLAERI
ncbi:PilZ domain-containing protein [Cohnella laeviribosi]|uniref:PilZ domain-containing protein n=1 Tax=Cohnella laeviribosi TaxID=380174 RepID=UPI003D1B4DD6